MGIKIWYISKYAVTPEYGNPTRQYFLSKYLAKAGHKVTLIYSRSSMFGIPPPFIKKPLHSTLDGFHQIMLPGPLVSLGFSLRRIWSWILFETRARRWAKKQNEKPDVVIVSSLSILTFLTGIYFKKKFGCRLVVEVRDIYPFTLVATKKFKASNPIIKYLSKVEKEAYEKADLIVSTLDYFDHHLNNIYPDGTKKFQWIPMGIDLEYYHGNSESKELDIQLPKGDLFVVGYAGTFGMTQATGVIFKVIKELKDDKKIHFLLAGAGVEKGRGLKLIEGQNNYTDLSKINKNQVPQMLDKFYVAFSDPRPHMKVKNRPLAQELVRLTSQRLGTEVEFVVIFKKTPEQVRWILNGADALLVTSLHEGSPNIVKEAMACNLPIVSVDCGDVAERLAMDSSSYVCQYDPELLSKNLSKVLNESKRSKGREILRSQGLLQEQFAKNLSRVYMELLN